MIDQNQEQVWMTAPQAAKRASVSVCTIYTEVNAGRLRAARIGGRRELRIRPSWVDAWLEASAEPVEIVVPIKRTSPEAA